MTSQNRPYEIITNDGYFTIRLLGKLDPESSKLLTSELPKLLVKPTNVILNCEHLSEISPSWIRAFVQLNQKLRSVNKHLRLILVSENIIKVLKNEGVDGSLRISASLRAALAEVGLMTAKALDVEFINPFLIATIKVLETQTTTKATAGQVYRKSSKDSFMGDISGVIGLISDAFSGSVVISFPGQTFLTIISRMLGEDYKEITKEIEDGAGELTNIIFGQAKVILNEKGYGIKTAIPSVVSGHDHSILQMTNGPRVVIPFESDAGPFFVEICASE